MPARSSNLAERVEEVRRAKRRLRAAADPLHHRQHTDESSGANGGAKPFNPSLSRNGSAGSRALGGVWEFVCRHPWAVGGAACGIIGLLGPARTARYIVRGTRIGLTAANAIKTTQHIAHGTNSS